jgi:hypothetical protein
MIQQMMSMAHLSCVSMEMNGIVRIELSVTVCVVVELLLKSWFSVRRCLLLLSQFVYGFMLT